MRAGFRACACVCVSVCAQASTFEILGHLSYVGTNARTPITIIPPSILTLS